MNSSRQKVRLSVEISRTSAGNYSYTCQAFKVLRKPEEFPALTDFIRHAVEHYVKELRYRKFAEECPRLAGEGDLTIWTEVDSAEYTLKESPVPKGVDLFNYLFMVVIAPFSGRDFYTNKLYRQASVSNNYVIQRGQVNPLYLNALDTPWSIKSLKNPSSHLLKEQ